MKTRIISYLSSILLFLFSCQRNHSESKEITEPMSIEKTSIPDIHSHIRHNAIGELILSIDSVHYSLKPEYRGFGLSEILPNIVGTDSSFEFEFSIDSLNGFLDYGFIPYEDYRYPHPVFFKRSTSVQNGKASINMELMKGKYDMVHWEAKGYGVLAYRLILKNGRILYDGRFSFSGPRPYVKKTSILEGPLIQCLQSNELIISLQIDDVSNALLRINDQKYQGINSNRFEWNVTGLVADSIYPYSIELDGIHFDFEVRTAPEKGNKTAFTFAYGSDSRNSKGGGERNIYGTNAYIMKKFAALASHEKARFVQFTGDLISGYLNNSDVADLQYLNWIRAVEPFWHYIPFNIGIGNHEVILYSFNHPAFEDGIQVDQFPFSEKSMESVFAKHFVNPTNELLSEDGSKYDPNPDVQDFPSYAETVYSYTYANVAMIVLNTDYWYSPSIKYTFQRGDLPIHDGGLHGYIMDQQLNWLKKEIEKFELDPDIDHVFVTGHTPFLPNGGHVKDDMWYHGNNLARPYISGKGVDLGIIERRDEMLDLFINMSSKVRAILTGDEHNYCRTPIGPTTPIYPSNWTGSKLEFERQIWQINNGAAGAPYYSQQSAPWSDWTESFSTQNALVLIDVDNESVKVRVKNPDTLEEIDSFELND